MKTFQFEIWYNGTRRTANSGTSLERRIQSMLESDIPLEEIEIKIKVQGDDRS